MLLAHDEFRKIDQGDRLLTSELFTVTVVIYDDTGGTGSLSNIAEGGGV